jgi:hypothetical protein
MEPLHQLALMLGEHQRITAQIAALIGRPAERGHIGEYIAAAIFDIALEDHANHRGSDGLFRAGPLAGRSVNIKWYGVNSGILDLAQAGVPDHYLVLTRPRAGAGSSRGVARPLTIECVYLFETPTLVGELTRTGQKIGTATSVRRHLWDAAEIYPAQSPRLPLTHEQRAQLALFQGSGESV